MSEYRLQPASCAVHRNSLKAGLRRCFVKLADRSRRCPIKNAPIVDVEPLCLKSSDDAGVEKDHNPLVGPDFRKKFPRLSQPDYVMSDRQLAAGAGFGEAAE